MTTFFLSCLLWLPAVVASPERYQCMNTAQLPKISGAESRNHDIKSRIFEKVEVHSISDGDMKLILRGGAMSRERSRNVVVLLVATALFNDMLQLTMLLPIIHTLVSSPPPLGVTSNKEFALGLFFASKDICQMAFAPIASVLTSRTSAHTALISSTIGLGIATFVFAEATTFWQLLLARGTQGAASAAVMCGGLSLIAETHPKKLRGSAIGFAQTGLASGLLCGPLIGGLLFQRMGRRKTFRLASGVVLANALAIVSFMGFSPLERFTVAAFDKLENREHGSLVDSSKRLLSNHDILLATLSTFIIHAVVGVIKPISQVVLDEEFGIPMLKRSFIISIATLSYFFAAPFSGWLSDHMSRSKLLSISLVLMAGSSIFFTLRHFGIWAFYTCVCLVGVSMGIQKSSSQTLVADLVDRHNLGEYSMAYALQDVADSLGLIIGPIVGLHISHIFSPSVGVASLGIFCLLLAPFVLRIQ